MPKTEEGRKGGEKKKPYKEGKKSEHFIWQRNHIQTIGRTLNKAGEKTK